MPAGLNIAYPPSRCPQCETPIRGRDNIPVLSWFLLKGRCRACGLGIATRYPKVEAFVALVFGLMAMATVVSSLSAPENANRMAILLLYFGALQFALIGMFLIDFDRNEIPKSLVVFFVCFATLLPIGAQFLADSWSSFGGYYVIKALANLGGATLVGITLAKFAQGHNFLAIALISAAFRGIEPVMFASLISTAIGFLCKKIRWFFTFLYSTLIGLDATYYILEGSSLVEFVPMRIAGPLRLFLITLFALGFIVKVAGISSKRDNS